MPFISIIIPTYNRDKVINRAVNSLLNQTFYDWETIVVDDGSTDSTVQLLKKICKRDKRVKLIRLAENKGVNYARNQGIAVATGDWISFLDSDDEYLPQGIEVMSKYLQSKTKPEVVMFMYLLKTRSGTKSQIGFDPDANWQEYSPTYEEIVTKHKIVKDVHHCVHRSIFDKGYRFPDFVNGVESLFFFRLAKDKVKFVYINEVVAITNQDSQQRLSHKLWMVDMQTLKAYRQLWDEHIQVIKKHPIIAAKYSALIAKGYRNQQQLFEALKWSCRWLVYTLRSS